MASRVVMIKVTTRSMRAEIAAEHAEVQVRSLDYIAASRSIGSSAPRIILVEILPNIANVLVVVAGNGAGDPAGGVRGKVGARVIAEVLHLGRVGIRSRIRHGRSRDRRRAPPNADLGRMACET
jgi:hypothetical protein